MNKAEHILKAIRREESIILTHQTRLAEWKMQYCDCTALFKIGDYVSYNTPFRKGQAQIKESKFEHFRIKYRCQIVNKDKSPSKSQESHIYFDEDELKLIR